MNSIVTEVVTDLDGTRDLEGQSVSHADATIDDVRNANMISSDKQLPKQYQRVRYLPRGGNE